MTSLLLSLWTITFNYDRCGEFAGKSGPAEALEGSARAAVMTARTNVSRDSCSAKRMPSEIVMLLNGVAEAVGI